MKYKIGDVSRILGISPDLLRYYEKKGIVHPVKDAHNDYRYYEPWDINFLMDCIWYKSFHFGIDQVAEIISDSTADEVADILDQKVVELRAQIRRNELLVRRAREHRADLGRLKNQLGQCVLRDSPEIVRYIHRYNYIYDNSEALQTLSQQWLEYMPFTHRCFEMPVEDISGKKGEGPVQLGLFPDARLRAGAGGKGGTAGGPPDQSAEHLHRVHQRGQGQLLPPQAGVRGGLRPGARPGAEGRRPWQPAGQRSGGRRADRLL